MTEDKPISIKEKLAHLPDSPGVYIMKDSPGRIIYIGKARVLKHRVRSYFTSVDSKEVKTRLLVNRIYDFDWIITPSEKEALLLENILIKKHHPKYNILLRDDKNYFLIRLTINEEWPRLLLVRKVEKGALHFGPYSDSAAVKQTVKFINTHFCLRKCKNQVFAHRKRPCIQYQIGRCNAPCCGLADRAAYKNAVAQVRRFLEGKFQELKNEVTRSMEKAAIELKFEEAAFYRDLAMAMDRTISKQVVTDLDMMDRDVFALAREGSAGVLALIHVRTGHIIGKRTYPLTGLEISDSDIIVESVIQYYSGEVPIPNEVIVDRILDDDVELLSDWLTEKAGHRVDLYQGQRGRPRELANLATENAASILALRKKDLAEPFKLLEAVATKLHLTKIPHRIECYDISETSGITAVGSRITFVDGEPEKTGYRKYKIRTVDKIDDYAMMREVLARRFSGTGAADIHPDLLIVDGGKGHLNIAQKIIQELNITDMDLAAITKVRDESGKKIHGSKSVEDIVYLPDRANPVSFAPGSSVLFLLQKIRDEAHRFALEYHRKLRSGRLKKSILDEFPGIGAKRRNVLLTHFGSVARLIKADIKEIAKVAGIKENLAQDLKQYLISFDNRRQ